MHDGPATGSGGGVGARNGAAVGACDGATVGACNGATVGAREGARDGAAVGAREGARDGPIVAVREGLCDGAGVGVREGAVVIIRGGAEVFCGRTAVDMEETRAEDTLQEQGGRLSCAGLVGSVGSIWGGMIAAYDELVERADCDTGRTIGCSVRGSVLRTSPVS